MADGNSAATATSVAIPATRQPRPPKSRAGAMRDGSTTASRSASVGRIRPARRAATSTDTTATATPARNAMTRAGTEPAASCTLNQAGDRPRSAIQRASSGAQITPSRQPTAEPATPTRAASARTIRATCAGVAPMVRSRARSRRRWATESPNAEAITVMATKPEIAAAMPRKVVRPASSVCPARRRGRPGAAPRRSAPAARAARPRAWRSPDRPSPARRPRARAGPPPRR